MSLAESVYCKAYSNKEVEQLLEKSVKHTVKTSVIVTQKVLSVTQVTHL